MVTANNHGKGRVLSVTLSPCHLVTLSLLLAAGCAGNRGGDGGDPLVGGGQPIPRLAPTPGGGSAGASAAAPIPPPPTHSATSPAALAGGVPQPLPGDRDLRIGTPAALPGRDTDGWRNPTGGATAGARLSAPESVDSAAARLTPTPTGNPGVALTSAPATAEYVQLQDALRARNVSWQHLEMSSETGEWKFTCTVADPKNKSLLTLHEARSRDAYGLAAIRAAIQDIDHPQAPAAH
jgi:hypothetical protein